MPTPNAKSGLSLTVEYPGTDTGTEGIFTDLPAKLSKTLDFDGVSLDGLPASKHATLWFRDGAKRIFHLSLVRKGGRCLVEMGGIDPRKVLKCITISRRHLDQWFGISASDVKSYERALKNDRNYS